jgi:ethanolamine ammonia-lyase large subunit
MRALTLLASIPVPPPRPDQDYCLRVLGDEHRFSGLKALLGAADYSKAGDRNAGLAAPRATGREAARSILSGLDLRHLYDRPLVDERGQVDSVMRVNYDLDMEVFRSLEGLTLGALKNRLLAAPAAELASVGRGLTGVMAAALAKLLDVHELIYLAQKIRRPTQARTRLGAPGTLSSRLQPNHPTDDLQAMTCLLYIGLSMGAGDALLGVNPAVDSVDNVDRILWHLDAVRKQTGAPTQICVLAHIKTQIACLLRGAPVEILFQSLAGTERTNQKEFDITVELLDDAYQLMRQRGPLQPHAAQFMYFETGQGCELTYGTHNGIDMTTAEALCYGLARRYDPFMVNNVTGFIGPETHLTSFEMLLANLQDHFMAKLLGLPMGMAPCYTLHSRICQEGQQAAAQLLAAAGANYYMDVCLGIDRMLAYFDTSAHDDQTMREIHGKEPAAEYLAWALSRGIFTRDGEGRVVRGPRWGAPQDFCASEAEWHTLRALTPSLYGLDHAGPRPAEGVVRAALLNQAYAREAVHCELRTFALMQELPFRLLRTQASTREAHLAFPALGQSLLAADAAALQGEPHRVQLAVSDGLSAEAIHHNIGDLLPPLLDGLAARGIGHGAPILIPYGRVKVAEELARRLGAELVVLLIGERPGGDALSARSMSAYLTYHRPTAGEGGEFECSVLSNIYSGGIPPLEAAAILVDKISLILQHQAAGNRLEQLLR